MDLITIFKFSKDNFNPVGDAESLLTALYGNSFSEEVLYDLNYAYSKLPKMISVEDIRDFYVDTIGFRLNLSKVSYDEREGVFIISFDRDVTIYVDGGINLQMFVD